MATCGEPYLGDYNNTDAADELFFRDEVALIVVELLEETLPPIPILVEEEEEVLQVDLVVANPFRQVRVHQVQNLDLSFRHYFLA